MNYASRLPLACNSDVDGFSVPKSVITKLCGVIFQTAVNVSKLAAFDPAGLGEC